MLLLPPNVSLSKLSINGAAMKTPPEAARIACSGRECATANIRFTLDTGRATRERLSEIFSGRAVSELW